MRFRSPALSIGQQILIMLADFPTFRYRREHHIPTWRGTLQPTETSPVYAVKLVYRCPYPPQVRILSPALQHDAPHRYHDGSLCLYYPPDKSWTPMQPLSKTIISWTALWLVYYELWLQTGIWHGPEAPHEPSKPHQRSTQVS